MKSKLLYIVPVLLCATLFLFGCGNSQDSNNNSSNKNENAAKTINFELNQTLKHEGLCEMSGLYAEVLDDAAKADGWVYYYTDTDKSP
ncbi:MAG: hypothetical protein MJ189_03725, partial [Coriobacteriales bacterium]|nr:hypothetical protein [Coriobacteriales bacterium]